MTEIKVTETTPRLLGINCPEPKGLKLVDSPLLIASKAVGSRVEYLAVFEQPLALEDFYHFLRRASHDRYSNGIFDVQIDWSDADRNYWKESNSTYGKPKPDGKLASLEEIHLALGQGWLVMEQHRPNFLAAITNANPEKHYNDTEPPFLHSGYNSRGNIVTGLAMEVRKYKLNPFTKTIMQQLQALGSDKLREMIASSRINRKLRTTEKKMTAAQLARRVIHRLGNSSTYSPQFYNSPFWNQILEDHMSANFQEGIYTQNEDPNQRFFKFVGPDEPKTEPVPIKDSISRSTTDYSTATYQLLYKNGRLLYQKTETIFRKEVTKPQPSITPAIHWTAQENNRQLDPHPLDSNSLAQVIRLRMSESISGESDLNALAGLLAIAYFSSDLRKTWPSKMRLPLGQREQIIGPGQIPVLAVLRINQLATTPLLATLEQAIN